MRLRPLQTGPNLPSDLTGPLHLLEPWWHQPGWWILAAALGLLLVWWWRRRILRAPVAPPAVSPPTPLPAASPAASPLVVAIRELRDRYRASGELREGLHRLSALLREHLLPVLPWAERRPGYTALELARRLEDTPSGPALRLLSDLQFGGPEPTPDRYDEAFRVAEELAGHLASRARQTWTWAPPVDPRTGRPAALASPEASPEPGPEPGPKPGTEPGNAADGEPADRPARPERPVRPGRPELTPPRRSARKRR